MIYALLFLVYSQQGLTINVQATEVRAMYSSQAACNADADKKRAAFTSIQGINVTGAAWRDAQCVAVPVTVAGATIAQGMEGL